MRDQMEKHQSWFYLLFIGLGLALGIGAPGFAERLAPLVWPLLGILLYATFTQIPLLNIARSFSDKRFMAALLVGNFIAIPAFLALFVLWLPLSPAVLAGVLLVLLVPCTDWFITFTQLGKGDGARAVAATPLLLLVQMIALPVYLWLFLGSQWFQLAFTPALLNAFTGLILAPLALAWLTEYVAKRHQGVERSVACLGLLPVPLLAVVVFIISASQVNAVVGLSGVLIQVVFISEELFSISLNLWRTLPITLVTCQGLI